jgi:membrane fusion protein (multidrug efflux system)
MALKTINKIEPGATPAPLEAPPSAPAEATSAPAKKGGFRKRILIGVAAVAAAAAIWFGGDWLMNGRFNLTTDNARVNSDITRVTPRVEGYVTAIHVSENQRVKAGDLLIELEAADFQTRVTQAKAELAQAEADAAQARARIAAQRNTIAEARAGREAADATADLSISDAKRLAELAERGWYPKARLEQAEAAQRTARAQLDQAQASVTAQQSQLTSIEAGSQSALAKVDAARAKLEAAELDLARTKIYAPVDGTVANKMVAEGQLLAPSQVALAIVVSEDKWVVANFKETQLAEMKPGQCAKIHVDAFPSAHITGKVDSIAPSTGGTFSLVPQDTATGNFTKIVQRVPVKIVLDKGAEGGSLATDLLRTGMQVTATVSTKPDCE